MTQLAVIRVFVGPGGSGGNPLGVFLDGAAIPPSRRLAVAAELGFSETVFVDDRNRGSLRIFTPGRELPFAGHPLVGTSWWLAQTGAPVDVLRPPAGEVPTWQDGDVTWIRGRPEWVHEIVMERLESPPAVEALSVPSDTAGSYYPWAWIDEAAGIVRSRYFAGAVGIAEDEATGAAAVVLGGRLGRPIEIRQGRGSRLLARPGSDGTVEVGGTCARVEEREFA